MKTIRWIQVGCAMLGGFGGIPPIFSAENAAAAGTRATAKNPVAPAKVDLNTASAPALETLPGIGPDEAQAIVAARPLKSEDDLEKIPGVGAEKAKRIKSFVTVSRMSSERSATTATAKPKVDINRADILTLESLPGVGPDIAQAIVAARPFKSTSDLDRVQGISAERLEQIRAEITIEPPRVEHRLGELPFEPTGRSSDQAGEKAGEKSDQKHAP